MRICEVKITMKNFDYCCIPRRTYRRCCPGVGVGIEPWAKTWRRRTAYSDK